MKSRVLGKIELQAVRDWFSGPGTEEFQSGEVIAMLLDHIDSIHALVPELARRAIHHPHCAFRFHNFPPDGKTRGPCNCGLLAIRADLDAALSPRHQSAEGAEGEGT